MYRSLTFLMPCHSLEDFPVHHRGQDADNLLAAWTALWHPALIAAAQDGPVWARADNPPADLAQQLVAIPDVAVKDLPAGLLQRAKSEGAILLRSGTREELLAGALDPLPHAQDIDPEIVADFLALGYCFLQVQLLTRQMRYASNLDEKHFRAVLTQGAQAAIEGDIGRAREQLSLCYDLLSQERDHYYSVDTYLLDLTLVAPTTLGDSLALELGRDRPLNLLIAGDVLEQLANSEQSTESLQLIRERLETSRITIVGGEDREIPIPLVDLETVLVRLKRGLQQYRQVLDHRPRVYGRRRFGLSPLLPGLLTKLDFHAALHVTLDDGRFPQGGQFKTRWEGLDGSAIDALARVPLDAGDPGVFLSLASKLGESMDMDHVATLAFAHWPGQASRWYEELCRVTRYTGALGKFMTFEGYISHTTLPGRLDRFEVDQYQSPYLVQAVIRKQNDPISSVARFWKTIIADRVAQTLNMFATIAADKPLDELPSAHAAVLSPEDECPNENSTHDSVALAAQRLTTALRCESKPGRLLLNPFPDPRRVSLEFSEDEVPIVDELTGVCDATDPNRVVAKVPAMGFLWVGTRTDINQKSKSAARKRKTFVADGNVLRNEFFEARVHPETGALVSIRSPDSRPNLLSQQLGFRLPSQPAAREQWLESENAPYTQMVARQVTTTLATPMHGEIESRGMLVLPDGQEAASFVQRVRAWRGSRTLELHIHVEPHLEPRNDPWNSYYACRFAWGDEMSTVSRSVHETRQRVESGNFEAPQFIEIDNGQIPVAVLTGGLSYHRMVGFRMLDTLLIVRGERQRDFRIGIAIGESNPSYAATAWMAPAGLEIANACPSSVNVPTDEQTAVASSGWFLHLGARNIQVTHLSPIVDNSRLVGFRARLLEVAGRAGRTSVWGPKPFTAARFVNFLGKPQGDCRIEHGKAFVDLSAFEWSEIEARWE